MKMLLCCVKQFLIDILLVILRKENDMDYVFAWLIIDGEKEFKDLKPKIKPRVKKALEKLGFPELATED